MHHAAVVVPGLAHFAAAANVRDRCYDPTIDHAEEVGVKTDVVRIAVGTVAG